MTRKTIFASSFLLLFWFIPNCSIAQLDSTTASISIVENYYQHTDSLDERDIAVLTLTFDDISDVGFMNVVVINNETGSIVQQITTSRSEMETSGVFFSDRIEFALFEPLPNTAYSVEVSPMNLLGAYTKMCFITLSI